MEIAIEYDTQMETRLFCFCYVFFLVCWREMWVFLLWINALIMIKMDYETLLSNALDRIGMWSNFT